MLREKSSDGTEGDYHLVSHYSCVLDDGTWRGRSGMSQCKGFVLLALYAACNPLANHLIASAWRRLLRLATNHMRSQAAGGRSTSPYFDRLIRYFLHQPSEVVFLSIDSPM